MFKCMILLIYPFKNKKSDLMIGKLIINEEQQEVRKYLERGKQDNVLG